MPRLRDDLLRNLPPDDQALMKILRRRPLKAYTFEELLPKKSNILDKLGLQLRLDALITQSLVMKFFFEGQTYYSKAKGRPKSKYLSQ